VRELLDKTSNTCLPFNFSTVFLWNPHANFHGCPETCPLSRRPVLVLHVGPENSQPHERCFLAMLRRCACKMIGGGIRIQAHVGWAEGKHQSSMPNLPYLCESSRKINTLPLLPAEPTLMRTRHVGDMHTRVK
jgi:hypothetical protein